MDEARMSDTVQRCTYLNGPVGQRFTAHAVEHGHQRSLVFFFEHALHQVTNNMACGVDYLIFFGFRFSIDFARTI